MMHSFSPSHGVNVNWSVADTLDLQQISLLDF
nr:MAG TPA: hypothetical protein [Bacteriophage sp.]